MCRGAPPSVPLRHRHSRPNVGERKGRGGWMLQREVVWQRVELQMTTARLSAGGGSEGGRRRWCDDDDDDDDDFRPRRSVRGTRKVAQGRDKLPPHLPTLFSPLLLLLLHPEPFPALPNYRRRKTRKSTGGPGVLSLSLYLCGFYFGWFLSFRFRFLLFLAQRPLDDRGRGGRGGATSSARQVIICAALPAPGDGGWWRRPSLLRLAAAKTPPRTGRHRVGASDVITIPLAGGTNI